jgi:hypothetical protein
MVVTLVVALTLNACQTAQTSTPIPAFTSAPMTPVPATPIPSRTAVLSELRNEVSARSVSDEEWESAFDAQTLYEGGGVRTGEEARVRVDISGGAIVRLAANSDFELAQAEATDPIIRLKLGAGKFWVAMMEALGGAGVEVETPAGVAAVRGSYMSVSYAVLEGRVVVVCLEGQCRLTASSGKFTDLEASQWTEIKAFGEDPSPPQPMDTAQYVDWFENFPGAPALLVTPPADAPSAPPATPTATPSDPTGSGYVPPEGAPTTEVVINFCEPDEVEAGYVLLHFGVGRWKTPREAVEAVGDSSPALTVSGQPVAASRISGPEWHTGAGAPPGWGFRGFATVVMAPGEYTLTAQWVWPDVATCTLTVVSP